MAVSREQLGCEQAYMHVRFQVNWYIINTSKWIKLVGNKE
jgi:hypothetical protein